MKPLRHDKTAARRIRLSIIRRLKAIKHPVGIDCDEGIIDWALHEFLESREADPPSVKDDAERRREGGS